MLTKKSLLAASALCVLIGLSACTSESKTSSASPQAKADGGAGGSTADGGAAARPKTRPKTAALKGKAGSTPPAGAKSLGPQTQPKAGAVSIPIEEVEVYSFEESFAADAPPDVISWAFVDGVGNYLWINGSVTCDDGSTDPNAGFVMEVRPDGTGSYLFSLPGCPSSDLFGCDFDADGNETACGACGIVDGALVCAVSS